MDDKRHPIDIYVGTRLRLLRKLNKKSQIALAELLGVSFQQVQKYEKATNRISSSVLYKIATTLNVDTSFFFEGYTEPTKEGLSTHQSKKTNHQILNNDSLQLLNAFYAIKDASVRENIMNLLNNLSNNYVAPTQNPKGFLEGSTGSLDKTLSRVAKS